MFHLPPSTFGVMRWTLWWNLAPDQQGKTSKEYLEIKKMAFLEPKLLHAMLKSLADSIGDYANYQVTKQATFFLSSRFTSTTYWIPRLVRVWS